MSTSMTTALPKGAILQKRRKGCQRTQNIAKKFKRLVAIARNVVRDVVGQPERHE